MITRRKFLIGLLAAPAIIKVAPLMPVKAWVEPVAAPVNPIFTGAIGRWEGMRIVEQVLIGGEATYRIDPQDETPIVFVPPNLMRRLREESWLS